MNETKSEDGIYYDEISVSSLKTNSTREECYDPNDPCPTPSCGESFINTIAASIYLCYWVCCLK